MYHIKKQLGEKIKSLRNKMGITQEYFAEKIGLSPRSVSFIENGKNFPSAETIANICRVFDIEPYKLFIFPNEKDTAKIKRKLIEKIETDDEYALFIYDVSKQLLT